MKLQEIENLEPEEAAVEFELERDRDHVIYLQTPAYILKEHGIICYEGLWCNIDEAGDEQVDFDLTAVYLDGEFVYWEQDSIAVTLYNLLKLNVSNMDFEVDYGYVPD